MANLNGSQYAQAYVTVPSSKIAPGNYNGAVRILKANYTITAEHAANDVILLGKLPAGAMVVDAILHVNGDIGDGTTLDLGFTANGVDSANLDAFIDGLVTTAAAIGQMVDTATLAGIFQEFTVETTVAVDIKATLGTTDSAIGKVISAVIFYVVN